MKEIIEGKIINEAIDKLKRLTGEDFHGYRSEIWGVINRVIKETEKTLSEDTEKFAYKDAEEFETLVGYKVGKGFKLGWDMARTTKQNLFDLAGEEQ